MSRAWSIDDLERPGRKIEAGFLSIDVDALIRKVTKQTFRSPHHYPVELVRSALARGAHRVDVDTDRTRIIVRDDGGPLGTERVGQLCRLLDPTLAPPERQAALAWFERGRGIDILAALAPSPSRVLIETAGPSGRGMRITIQDGRIRTRSTSAQVNGTVVVIQRSGADPGREKAVLEDWCQYSDDVICVNGSTVSGHRVAPHALAGSTLGDRGNVWLPPAGDVCRLWFLDHGIRFKESVRPPVDGLVFEAAVECEEREIPTVSTMIRETARELYGELASRHATAPENLGRRIEELLFLHYRRTRDGSLVSLISPFEVLGSGQPLNLDQVRRLASAGSLRALKLDDDPERYQTHGGIVVNLTPQQWDFLSEHASVTLQSPPLRPRAAGLTVRLIRWVSDTGRSTLDAVNLAMLDPVDEADMDPRLADLVDRIERELGSDRSDLAHTPTVVVSSRGRSRPGRLMRHGDGFILAIYRDNPLVRDAMKALANDGTNIGMVVAMFTEGRTA